LRIVAIRGNAAPLSVNPLIGISLSSYDFLELWRQAIVNQDRFDALPFRPRPAEKLLRIVALVLTANRSPMRLLWEVLQN
jgi:hypothetical protein